MVIHYQLYPGENYYQLLHSLKSFMCNVDRMWNGMLIEQESNQNILMINILDTRY